MRDFIVTLLLALICSPGAMAQAAPGPVALDADLAVDGEGDVEVAPAALGGCLGFGALTGAAIGLAVGAASGAALAGAFVLMNYTPGADVFGYSAEFLALVSFGLYGGIATAVGAAAGTVVGWLSGWLLTRDAYERSPGQRHDTQSSGAGPPPRSGRG